MKKILYFFFVVFILIFLFLTFVAFNPMSAQVIISGIQRNPPITLDYDKTINVYTSLLIMIYYLIVLSVITMIVIIQKIKITEKFKILFVLFNFIMCLVIYFYASIPLIQ